MTMRTDGRPGRGPDAARTWTLCAAALAGALAGALALAGCDRGGGGAGGGGMTPPDDGPGDPPPAGSPSVPLVTELHFDYALTRDGEDPIEEAGSTSLGCPGAGCPADDLRVLAGREETGTRDGFRTVTGTTGGPPLTRAFAGASATVSGAAFRRYGFWGEHGHAAVEIGTGDLTAEADGRRWTGAFEAAHAWAAGEASGTNPAGTGSATWSGIAEAARLRDFAHLEGTAELRIADLSRPLVDVDIDLDDGGDGVELRWVGMQLSGGAFARGAVGADRIEGRFHGPGHGEAFGTFDDGTHVGAFGAKRQP